jgi:hypothetical protein
MDNTFHHTQQDYTKNRNPMNEEESVQINRILRGELSAINAYKQVLKKITVDPETTRLSDILNDHEEAISYWRNQMNGHNFSVDETTGPWGAVVDSFIATAKLFGTTATLKALKEGEEHGLNEYKDLLEDEDITADHKRHIRDVFIPNQERHIFSLESMIHIQ